MENNQTELTAEEVLQAHIERNTDFKFDNIMEVEGTVKTLAKCGLSAMQEYADLRTAALQAEKAELLEALKWTTAGLDAAVNHTKRIYQRQSISTVRDGSRKSKPISAILSDAEALLSKHTK